jgi:DNA recombination protein RmuC
MDIWIGAAALALLAGMGLVVFALMGVSGALKTAEERERKAGTEAALLELKLRDLAAAQSAVEGRVAQASDSQAKTLGELQRLLAERIEALDKRLGDNLKETASKTAESLGGLQARLTIIDEAQKNLTDLSGQVVGLQQILSNKQTRGAYGQGQMESIVRDALPATLYEFQATLSNKNRPDCLIRLPGVKTAIVIDSKFPLEAFEELKRAASDPEKKVAEARIRADVSKHVKDIADRYLIPGETQTPAIMFVPSESLYAELHDGFADVIQKAQRAQVIVVSPNILLLAINTVQTVMKDARMREQANLIQKEVGILLNDVRLLSDRVGKLQTHFGHADADIKNILISTGKVVGRAEKIERVELAGTDNVPQLPGARDP